LGTPHHWPPEQIFGERDLDARADVWSLGIILYECLTGRRPFEGDNAGQVMRGVLLGRYEALPEETEVEVVDLVRALLELDRNERPGDLQAAFRVLSKHTDQAWTTFEEPRRSLVPSIHPSTEGRHRPDPSAAGTSEPDVSWVARGGSWGSNSSGLYAGQRVRIKPETPIHPAATGVGLNDENTVRRLVRLSPFYVQSREVTVADYRALLEPQGRPGGDVLRPTDWSGCAVGINPGDYCRYTRTPKPYDDQPVTCLGRDAAAYCAALGGQLPTEAQLEYVAGGRDSWRPTRPTSPGPVAALWGGDGLRPRRPRRQRRRVDP